MIIGERWVIMYGINVVGVAKSILAKGELALKQSKPFDVLK